MQVGGYELYLDWQFGIAVEHDDLVPTSMVLKFGKILRISDLSTREILAKIIVNTTVGLQSKLPSLTCSSLLVHKYFTS